MATKPVALTPNLYSYSRREPNTLSFNDWQTYRGAGVKADSRGYVAFSFYLGRDITLSNVRISYIVVGDTGADVAGKISVSSTYKSSLILSDFSAIKSFSGSSQVGETINYNRNIDFSSGNHFYILISCPQYASCSVSINAVAEADIPELSIRSISPDPVNVGDQATITFENRLGNELKVEVLSGQSILATFNYVDEDEFQFTPQLEWLSSKSEIEATVKATDSTDAIFTREATKNFKIKKESIGVELTAVPASSGPNSKIDVTFKNRKGNTIYLTVEGAAKGSANRTTLVSRTNITSEIKNEQYSIAAPDNWFVNINGDEMTVYLKFEDPTLSREETPNFVLKAGDGTKPIVAVTLTNHYKDLYKDTLVNAGYTKYIVNYSQVTVQARVKTMAGVPMGTVTAKFNNSDTTLTYIGPYRYDREYVVYEGTTTKTVSSSSTSTITVTATDARLRKTEEKAYIDANDIQTLRPISLRQSQIPTVGQKLTVDPSDYVGSYSVEIYSNSHLIVNDRDKQYKASAEWDTFYSGWFTGTDQRGAAYISLAIYVWDGLNRDAVATYYLNAPNPQFLKFEYENIPDSRMPETDKSGNPYGVVSGYSKVRLNAKVRWYYNDNTVTVAGGYGAVGGTMTKGQGVENEYGHEDIEYTFETPDVVATSSANIEFTPTAEDSGRYNNRTGKTIGSKLLVPITKLRDISLSVSPSGSVSAGQTITVTPSNVVGDYTYVFATNTKTELAKSDEAISEESFSQECEADWFTKAGAQAGNLTVELVVTDVLGRKNPQPYRFTVRLADLTLQVTPTSLVYGNTVSLSISGTAGQTITVAFTTPNLDGTIKQLYSFTTTSPTPDPVTCPKNWFTGFDNKKQLDITVTASYGSGADKKEKSVPIKLNYPDLGLAITKTVDSQEVAVTSATVGENLNYTFSNLEGESVNVDYIYTAQNNRQLLQYGPYSAAQTIATPQLFDLANPPVTKSPSMQVDIVISDARDRKATVSNFTINASASMGPSVSSSSFAPINPVTVDSEFVYSYIGGVTRISAAITAETGSKAKVTEAILSIDGANVTMTSNGIGSVHVESVNLTVGYGLNSGGEVVENSRRAATVHPINVRKNSQYKVYYSGQYTAYCALWKDNTFGRFVTNEQDTPNEVLFDTGDCNKVYVSLMRTNEASGTDPVDVEEASSKLTGPFGYVFTYVGNSPLQVDAIYDPRPVNLTVGYGLNSDGEVVENPQRAATAYPISVRKNNTYRVNYSGQYTAQCALWSGDTFDRIVTNSQYSPYEVSFDTGDCDKVYVSLMRTNEASGTDPVDVEEANMTIRMIDPFDMAHSLTPISLDVTLKDERGLSDTMYVATVFAYPYNAPNASIGYHRCNQDGTPNDSGDNCLLTCDFSFEGLWANTFPPSPDNRGYVTVSTTNYDETKQFDFVKRKKSQFTLEAGYGLNSSGEVVSNPLRAATVVPIEMPSGWTGMPSFTVTFSGDYVVDYAGFYGTELNRQGTITSSGGGSTAPDIEDLYISLRRANETAESDPVDIAEANVQVTWDLGDSEDGSFEFLIPNMSIEQTYQITVTLTDLITSTVYTVTLSTGYAIMDFYRGGKGVAIGKVAEHENMLEINPDWEIKTGKITLKIGDSYVDLSTLLSQIKQQLGI